jgi:hypothetical protein
LLNLYKGLDSTSSINSNNTFTDDIICIITDNINNNSPTETTTPPTETIASPTETNAPNLNTKHSISIWKQEYINSISNLLVDLNDLITIENRMNRLTHDRPAEIDPDTKNIAEEIATLLNNLNNCEPLVNLKNITYNVWKEKNGTKTKGK